MSIENTIMRSKVELNEKWKDWSRKIPPLHFEPEWNIAIIPPFAGALVRFVVSYNNKEVSVYFDGYSNLGYMYNRNDEPLPYWEIYPDKYGMNKRYSMNETDKMMADIEEILSD